MKNKNFIVAGQHKWCKLVFEQKIKTNPGNWFFISDKKEMTSDFLKIIKPEFIFFLHWSHLVPEDILRTYQCIGFHMTDLPFGRGGSPLQNLILRGIKKTMITAFKLTEKFDEGPFFFKRELILQGNAEEIFLSASEIEADMIHDFLTQKPQLQQQTGKSEYFKRRTPADSALKLDNLSLREFFDQIRMLDAEDYPKAFFIYNGFKFEFRRSAIYTDHIEADVKISKTKEL